MLVKGVSPSAMDLARESCKRICCCHEGRPVSSQAAGVPRAIMLAELSHARPSRQAPYHMQAHQEKILEAQEMERALAKYMESLREKEEQQRCKAGKLKADRESQAS